MRSVDIYVPALLTATDYPGLVQETDRQTIAVGTVLAVAELRLFPERNRNLVNFVEAFFTGMFQSLLNTGHHPKWHDVNLAADLPGLASIPAAERWLQRNLQIAKAPERRRMRLMFSRFLDERRQANGEERHAGPGEDWLFQQFRDWQTGRRNDLRAISGRS